MNWSVTNNCCIAIGVLLLGVSLSGCRDKTAGTTAGAPATTNATVANDPINPEPETKPTPATPAEEKPKSVDVSPVAVASAAETSQPVATPAKSDTPAKSTEPTKTTAEGVSETRVRTPPRGKKSDNSGIAEITFDDIKFDMKEKEERFRREMLTPAIEALNGKTVRLRGYILPSFQQRGLTQFVLMRDNMECCFGPGAWIYDCVIVEMKEGKTADYTVRPVAIEGTFEVSEFLDADGKHLAVYRVLGEHAK
jgi:hypothetical protein